MMKLNLESVKKSELWPEGYELPKFDIAEMATRTAMEPTWLHMGAGNIFRIFVAGVQQDLIESGLADKGIIVYEAFDEGIIPASFKPYDNLTLGVTLYASGSVKKRVIASMPDAFSNDLVRLRQLIATPSLQIISFTITENGYVVKPENVCLGPRNAHTTMEQVAAGLLSRFEVEGPPLALVTMDNFAENGTKLSNAVLTIAEAWEKAGKVPIEFIDYVRTQAFPWTMIDKITPRPSEDIAALLAKDGYKDTEITKTQRNTFVASFVNAESAQYLIIEDNFPNGRPPLEKAGVYMTDRETVRKMDSMKVCACLNPLHTALATAGMMLELPTVSACMKDPRLVKFLRTAAGEALPVVSDPGIIDPKKFLEEVLTERFPNPFIPDTPARIACDNSQKIPVRFGEMLKARKAQNLPTAELEAFPLFAALWLRYLMGKNDRGQEMAISPDPLLPEAFKPLHELQFGEKIDLRPMLSHAATFGVDLYEAGLGEKIEGIFAKLSTGAGAVNQVLG